jgi:serine-type D-Ala-D-Ala carboxypeptidase (penicillin-binding protein 5/6)
MKRNIPAGILVKRYVWTLALLWVLAPGLRAEAAEPFSGSGKSAVLMDAATGEVLAEQNAHTPYPPASMVKMMVALIVMEKVKEGSLHMSDPVTASRQASKTGGSQVYLKEGEVFTLEQLMEALMTHSANDAAVAIAEAVAGSRESFVDLMNLKAKEIGMQDSVFYSVHGLPPGKGQKEDLCSAYDLAVLGRALVQYPQILVWSSQPSAPFRNGTFTLHNCNRLLHSYKGVDGLKTGYTRGAGFGVTATAKKDSTRMIAVVMGEATNQARTVDASRLLTLGFNMFKTVKLAGAGEPSKARLKVAKGKAPDVGLRYGEDLVVSVRSSAAGSVLLAEELPAEIQAPVKIGQVVGRAVVKSGDQTLASCDILAAENVEKAGLFDRFF